MWKIIKLRMSECLMTLILISAFILNLYPTINSIDKSAFGHFNRTQLTNLSQDDTKFNQAVAFTLQHEGGLENDKADKGGITKYGISYKFLNNLLIQKPQYLSLFSLDNISQLNPSVIKNLTLGQAIAIYKLEWWDKYHYGSIKNPAIATKVFDYSVNMGSTPAVKMLQKAYQNETGTPVPVNGELDNSTVACINSLNASQSNQLLYTYENVACNYYANIAKHHPGNKKFLGGWLNRANDNNFVSA